MYQSDTVDVLQPKNIKKLESSYNFLFVKFLCFFLGEMSYLPLTVSPVLHSYLFDLWQQDQSSKCINQMQWMCNNKKMSQDLSHP